MFTMPNLLSLTRIPLALLFVGGTPWYRGVAVLLAALTDYLDGYWARRFCADSPLGRLIDPMVDKFFVFCCMGALLREKTMDPFQAFAFLTRDTLLLLFGCQALFFGYWSRCHLRSIWWGKVFTTLQFSLLLSYVLFGSLPNLAFWPLVALGPLFYLELAWRGDHLLY